MKKGAETPIPAQDLVQAKSVTPEVENSNQSQRGVIRQLQEGHFKGVPDVRLRINFHDEIVALENEELRSVANGEIDSFTETIAGFLVTQEYTAGQDLTEMVEMFKNHTGTVKADFLDSESLSTENLMGAIGDAFEELVVGLNALIPTDPAEEAPRTPDAVGEDVERAINTYPTEESVTAILIEEPTAIQAPAVEPDNTESQIAQLISALTREFDAALGILSDGLSRSSVFPKLSEPNGNGGAFDKFLDVYNDLYAVGNSGESTPSFDIEA
jgi:hypothetical protein